MGEKKKKHYTEVWRWEKDEQVEIIKLPVCGLDKSQGSAKLEANTRGVCNCGKKGPVKGLGKNVRHRTGRRANPLGRSIQKQKKKERNPAGEAVGSGGGRRDKKTGDGVELEKEEKAKHERRGERGHVRDFPRRKTKWEGKVCSHWVRPPHREGNVHEGKGGLTMKGKGWDCENHMGGGSSVSKGVRP